DLDTNVALENERLQIKSARLSTKDSSMELTGAVHDLSSPRGEFDVTAHLLPKDLSQSFHLPVADRGAIDFDGKASFSASPFLYNIGGKVRGRGINYSNRTLQLTGTTGASDRQT